MVASERWACLSLRGLRGLLPCTLDDDPPGPLPSSLQPKGGFFGGGSAPDAEADPVGTFRSLRRGDK